MGALGTYLRRARETRGMDLREAAQQTRISHAYLAAIENEDFSKLPGEVFVKGFLRNYAKFLGISEDEVMRLYAESKTPLPLPAQAPAAEKPEAPKRETREPAAATEAVFREEKAGAERYVWAAVALLAVTAALLVAIPERRVEKTHGGPAHSGVTGTAHLATVGTPTVRQEKLYLDVTAMEDLWILVRTDSSPQKKAVLKKGESVTWSADERFLLSIGNAAAAKILLNGKELTISALKNTAVRDVVITATGVAAPKVAIEQPRARKPKAVAPPISPAGAASVPTPEVPAAPPAEAASPAKPETAQ